MKTAGYSGTPLAKKLGIKQGSRIRLENQPEYYFDLFTDFPGEVTILRDITSPKDFIHHFTSSADDLHKNMAMLKTEIFPNGMIWISWPKKASGVSTDVTEDVIRQIALAHGLVDVKVCAVDNTWSGLKLVVPVRDR